MADVRVSKAQFERLKSIFGDLPPLTTTEIAAVQRINFPTFEIYLDEALTEDAVLPHPLSMLVK